MKKMKNVTPAPTQAGQFINRELSWLEFNDRVLEEARDKGNQLLERFKFLAISSTNLDEFFMVRVASLKDLVNARYNRPDPAGLTPQAQLAAISRRTHTMVGKQYSTLNRTLLPALAQQGVRLLGPGDLTSEQQRFVRDYFTSTVFPILTPMAVDAARPFPLLASRSINLIVRIKQRIGLQLSTEPRDSLDDSLEDQDDQVDTASPHCDFALVQIPTVIPRLLELPAESGVDLILLEDVVRLHLDQLFSGVIHGKAYAFRIMRNADFDLEEDDAADLLKEIEKQLKLRQWGQVIRLEAEEGFETELLEVLIRSLAIQEPDVFKVNGPLDLSLLFKISRLSLDDSLRFAPYEPQTNPQLQTEDLFEAIRQKDIILHHPFESFDPVIELIRQAAEDPDVLAIKQTLYRVGGESPIVRHLAAAAERGKQVLVLVELKARFDEENNIQWARRLEQAGCHVIYGLVGLKTHSKITLIVRRDDDRIRRYIHLGTGNYNDITAGIYTDLGLMTCNEGIGVDASEFFNMLSGYSSPLSWRKLAMAPFWLRDALERRIERERNHALAGKPARIIAKLNSLVDPAIIESLYRASQAGVRVELIVRGICCLRPGVPGLSDLISVRSIVGRFLEHSRIFYFYNDGEEDLFLSSADWMPRNLDRRIELMFPIEDPQVWQTVMNILEIQLSDTERSWLMGEDGMYTRVDRRGKMHLDCQQHFCQQAIAAGKPASDDENGQILVPVQA
jgi:polyphosphate kinase